MKNSSNSIQSILEKVQRHTGRKAVFSDRIWDVKAELKTRRMLFIGSDISFYDLVKATGSVDDTAVEELSRYLAEKSMNFWEAENPKEIEECMFRFYRLAIYAFCVGDESGYGVVDDLIDAAETLVQSREGFIDFMQYSLPDDLLGELFDFDETYNDELFSFWFPDAVLGAVCIFLGVIPDRISLTRGKIEKSIRLSGDVSAEEANHA